ncbi:MAG: hypothetical protein IJL87_09555 [Clostridia bacterium]|nr:hypothetical protein [Clostridia bacterium]
MTDIHTHILPNVDDGAESFNQAMTMIHQAYCTGTRAIILTPHCNIPGLFKNYADEIAAQMYFFAAEAQKNIPVRIYPGMEVFATDDLPELIDEKKVLTLNNSRYMLVEFDFYDDPARAEKVLEQIRARGIVPIIAHPERYSFIQACPLILYDWINEGCLSQINKDSLLGAFGGDCSRTARLILRHNLTQFVASDAHTHISRNTEMASARRLVRDFASPQYAQLLFDDNPAAVIKNMPVFVPEPVEPPM